MKFHPKVTELIDRAQQGAQPVIVIKEAVDDNFDVGMKFRVLDVANQNEDCQKLLLDFSEFVALNQSLEKPNWRNDRGEAVLRWSETKNYPTNYRVTWYVGERTEEEFDFVDSPTQALFKEYQQAVAGQDEPTPYILWLEQRLIALQPLPGAIVNEYTPDTVSPPSDSLQELFEEGGWSLDELSATLDLHPEICQALLNGKIEITPPIANLLAQTFALPASFWLARQLQYNQWRDRPVPPELPTESAQPHLHTQIRDRA